MERINWRWFVGGYRRDVSSSGIITYTPIGYTLSICPYRSDAMTVPIDTPVEELHAFGEQKYREFINDEHRRLTKGGGDE